MSNRFRFVCATRSTPEGFLSKSALGKSLELYQYPGTELKLSANNTEGLPTIYNKALLEAASNPAIMIFIHDDVHLCDFFWPSHILAGLNKFDVIGVAGNRRRLPYQPAWCFPDDRLMSDSPENLSGIVAHGKGYPPERVNVFGAPGHEVKLLDGIMLIARSETLISKDVYFDERFDFHHYDMDFCRQAESRGLKMGTTNISLIHESFGDFMTDSWRNSYATYIDKWKS